MASRELYGIPVVDLVLNFFEVHFELRKTREKSIILQFCVSFILDVRIYITNR